MRNQVICLLGLPFDAVTMDDTVQRVREAARTRQRLFLSTPNLNFLIGCTQNAAFRQSVIDSDMSVADGMPLVWMSRLLGVPLPERVTGSGLFERLRSDPLPAGQAPLKVYFFGGPPGVARAASQQLNAMGGGLVCVGHESPGFGSIEEMSSPDMLARINASGADFLIVALGAVKGQAWIQHNRARLEVPVISHLGAVVNFAAGTVSRAPAWMQKTGLEWLWRIKEEPTLWRRYWSDGTALLGLVFGQLLPYALWLRRRSAQAGAGAGATLTDEAGFKRLSIQGLVPDPVPPALQSTLAQAAVPGQPLLLDLSQAGSFGPAFAGELLRLEKALGRNGQDLRIAPLSPFMQRLFDWNGLGSLLAKAAASQGDDKRQPAA